MKAENESEYCITLRDNLRLFGFLVLLHEEDFLYFVLFFFFNLNINQHAEIGAEKFRLRA